jgi:hypothetical protein
MLVLVARYLGKGLGGFGRRPCVVNCEPVGNPSSGPRLNKLRPTNLMHGLEPGAADKRN